MSPTDTPLIFIFGMGRSGTSWLGSIFDSHPHTFYIHEPDAVCFDARIPYLPTPEAVQSPGPEVIEFGQRLMRVRALRAMQKSRTFHKAYRSDAAEQARRSVILGLLVAEKALGWMLPISRTRVPDFTNELPYLPVVKSVHSVGRLPLLARAFPSVRFIFVVRHPAGVAASKLRGARSGEMPVPHIFDAQLELPLARSRGLTREACRELRDLERVVWPWAIMNDYVMDLCNDLANVRTVRYEDLCENPLQACRDLFEWAGLSWAEQTDSYVRRLSATEQDARDYHGVVRNPRIPAFRWKAELDQDSLAAIEKIVSGTRPGALFDYE